MCQLQYMLGLYSLSGPFFGLIFSNFCPNAYYGLVIVLLKVLTLHI